MYQTISGKRWRNSTSRCEYIVRHSLEYQKLFKNPPYVSKTTYLFPRNTTVQSNFFKAALTCKFVNVQLKLCIIYCKVFYRQFLNEKMKKNSDKALTVTQKIFIYNIKINAKYFLKVKESRYNESFFVSGSIKKLFLIDFVNIYQRGVTPHCLYRDSLTLKVWSCKFCNNKYMIASTQINTAIFTFTPILLFKLLSHEVLFPNRKGNRNC